jgi:hypothetical protein
MSGSPDLLRSGFQDSAWSLARRMGVPTRVGLPAPVVWIEHHPPIATDGDTETFDLVTFSSYEVREREPYLGETRLTVGEATWKCITRGMVETVVGGEV